MEHSALDYMELPGSPHVNTKSTIRKVVLRSPALRGALLQITRVICLHLKMPGT